jgi:hypothetical protein
MGILRRILGVFVMIAGIVGLLLSLAGLVGLAVARPTFVTSVNAAINTLLTSVDTSQRTLVITNEALGATVVSVDALSEMLNTTAVTVEDTQPVIGQINGIMGDTLPSTLLAASESLLAAEDAAQSLESAIKSFETFQVVLASNPILSAFVPATPETYNPEKPLADSLGDLSESIKDMPAAFEDMSTNMEKADDNLELVKANLITMSQSVSLISASLGEYQAMISESEASMDSLRSMLSTIQSNLGTILNATTVALGLFFLWLLAAQVVIFSQGWELYKGTAGRMEDGTPQPRAADPVSTD